MKLIFDLRLQEDLVRAQLMGEPEFFKVWTKLVEPIYQLPEEERDYRFAQAYKETFEKHQLGQPLEAILAEFPFTSALNKVLVIQADGFKEEGVELSRDKSQLGIRLPLKRFLSRENLSSFLSHELMRLSDILDTAFGYRQEPVSEVAAADYSVAQRYRVLWDVYLDGRLARQGREDRVSQEERQREFERSFFFLPRRERLASFLGLWSASGLTHLQLLEIAREPLKVVHLGQGEVAMPPVPLPGSLCPLCHFPTYCWVQPEERVSLFVRADFPSWSAEEGLCEHCYEGYQLKEGVT